MASTFTYPSSIEFRRIEAVLMPRLTQNSPVFRIFPFEGARSHLLEWSQMDTYGGMQQIRGMNGQPPRVARVGEKSFLMRPGVYGEHIPVDEMELTVRAANRVSGAPIPIDDLTTGLQNQLLTRRLNRQEWLGWQVLVYGRFMVLDARGVAVHAFSYAQQQYTPSVTWATVATATPLADFRGVQLLSRGQSVSFGANATAYMNRTTANYLLSNTNAADLGGQKTLGGANIQDFPGINRILGGQGLPQIEVYDEGYIDDSGTFQLFIPDNKVVVVGRRVDGAALGNFRYTLNANNAGSAPAPYTRVIDRFDTQIPRSIEVHDGFNGGIVMYFAGAIVLMNV
jgi:hypothetical protein